jgi:hypothetical protein
MDWVIPRLENSSLRITLESMQRTVKDFLHSQKLRPQMEQPRDQNPSLAPTAVRTQKHSA